ncbi:SdpI family protein [Devosia sp.]|uniref:SdpI family protein n=1 Tax=Devosia sp. TaxID=1871048 RepID=UPI001AD0135F|nr:SdpI family protein [Devosia sp.]MBN9334025.1 SdpI family protein [Devosia sp.]
MSEQHVQQKIMPSLVTRFHLLIFAVTLSITAVGILRIPEGFAFPAHWQGSGADWVWPRDIGLSVAPAIGAVLILGFFILGRLLTANHMAKVQHILDPALSLLLAVPAACQLGLLFIGIGSDLDLFRGTAIALAATLALLGIVLFHAERHSYAGLRMPWPVRSDRAWLLVHRLSGVACGLAAGVIAVLAWFDAGPGILAVAFALSLIGLPLFAGLVSLAVRRA